MRPSTASSPATIKEESGGYDSKIVIFGHHRDVLEKLAGSLENAVLVTGETPLVMPSFRPDLLGERNACDVSAKAQKSLLQHDVASLRIAASFC